MNHNVNLTSMGINFITLSFAYLYGSFEPELVKKNYLVPNGFVVTEETLVYPPKIFLIGKKQVKLTKEKNGKEFNATFEMFFSKKGFVGIKIILEITLADYTSISTDLFSVEDSNFEMNNVSFQDMSLKLIEHFFGKPYIEMFFEVKLKSAHALEYCKKYGVKLTDHEVSMGFSYYITVTEEENWTKLKEIEVQKTAGGSIFKNTVALPNFDHTLVSKNPDIHILNASGVIIYTNKEIIENTFNFIVGIRYQALGIMFLKSNIKESLSLDYVQLKEYYNNHQFGTISWFYIDKTLTYLENRLDDLIAFEFEFLEVDDPNYFDFQNFSLKEKLNQILQYTSAQSQYQTVKKIFQENLSSLRAKVSDKGEKEENMAYNRIVAVIGLLASFQVVSEILPVFDKNTVNQIRIAFIFVLIPLLIVIWYFTVYNNKKKMGRAEKLDYKSKIIKQKQILEMNLHYFKESAFIEKWELSKAEVDKEVAIIEQKIKEVEDELTKIDEQGL